MDTIKVTLSVEGPPGVALDALAQASVSLWAAHVADKDRDAHRAELSAEVQQLRSEGAPPQP